MSRDGGDGGEIGLFVTRISALDNIQAFIGNSGVSAANTIRNFSASPARRVDPVDRLNHVADHATAIPRL